MKKGLSVLLVVAALFGFYGSAVSLNDVLACKDYWEEEGEKSTADMNKLEDGLNQLKENEQAYLDGVKQVADGEVALADAEKQLAEGEEKLADGRAELAKGEADYAAAPAKLAAGEKKLAAGVSALAAGKAKRAAGAQSLAEAIAARAALANVKRKIDAVEPAYQPWLKKWNALVKSIVTMDKKGNPQAGVLYDAGATAVGLATVNNGFDTIQDTGEAGVKQAEAMAKNGVRNTIAQNLFNNSYENLTDAEKNTVDSNITDAMIQDAINGNKELAAAYERAKGAVQIAQHLKNTYSNDLLTTASGINSDIETVKGAEYQATALRKSKLNSYASDAEGIMDKILADPYVTNNAETLASLITGANQVKNLSSSAQNSTAKYNSSFDELAPAKATKLGKKVATAAKAILSNKDIAAGLTSAQKKALQPYMNAKSITALQVPELLYGTMTLGTDKKDDGKGSLLDNFKAISAAAAGGLNQYNDGIGAGQEELNVADAQIAAGEEELNAGRAELAKGYADYKAAPAKLAAGRQQLAEGEATLADGYKQYEEGKKTLADGKEKLAEYEDGEQQVRDGLATLVGTEPDLDLASILDRLNGDADFDNGDKHLDIDEGLNAVDVGRGYQADDGDLITKEIMARAVGTGGLLAAGVLAVIAALLSFLKKNKGAGVFAILAAAAGAFGAFYGTQAGTYFSSLAGSTVGAIGWIAAGILGAVALVHAIVHFAAGKAA